MVDGTWQTVALDMGALFTGPDGVIGMELGKTLREEACVGFLCELKMADD